MGHNRKSHLQNTPFGTNDQILSTGLDLHGAEESDADRTAQQLLKGLNRSTAKEVKVGRTSPAGNAGRKSQRGIFAFSDSDDDTA